MSELNEISDFLLKGVLPKESEYNYFIGKRVSDILFPSLGDISSFYFKDAVFSNVIFSKFSFFGADLGESTFINCCFKECSMNKSNFYQARLINCVFSDTSFRGVRMSEAKIKNCVFAEADFSVAIITKTTITNSVLSNLYTGLLDSTELVNSIWKSSNEEGMSDRFKLTLNKPS